MQFQESAGRSEAVIVRVIFQAQLGVIEAAGRNEKIADQRRITHRTGGNEERADGIQRLDYIWLAGDDGAAEIGIEEIFLNDAPGDEFLGSTVCGAAEQAVGDAVLKFICVGERVVIIEANNPAEIVHAIDVTIDNVRLDGVFPFCSVKIVDAFERRQAQIESQL